MTRFNAILLAACTAIVAVGLTPRGERPEPVPVRTPAPEPIEQEPAPKKTSQPTVWHKNLASALLDHKKNGGQLAIIISTQGCTECQRRLNEAKKLKSSPYSWVYCMDTDPACDLDLEGRIFPVFATLKDGDLLVGVAPESLGLKERLP